jgi:hypothetical protein
MIRISFGTAFLLAFVLLGAPRAALAAEGYDNCTGFITSVPAVITTQGTWCLKQDLTTSVATGNAITINANNVTIDCNDFKLGGLAAGLSTQTNGIYAQDRLNETVRHCNIRGFYRGVYFVGNASGGHVIEDNRFDGNTYVGLDLQGEGSVLRRNRLFDTGGSTLATSVYAVITTDSVDILDNTISGVIARAGTGGFVAGITTIVNVGGSLNGNRVRGLVPDGAGGSFGIYNSDSVRLSIRENDLTGNAGAGSQGIACFTGSGRAIDNVINGFVTGLNACNDDGGNVIAP